MGGSIVMEDPLVLVGLFHRHPILKWMRTGGTPIPGNLHIYIMGRIWKNAISTRIFWGINIAMVVYTLVN